jgi:hypothetical protein
MGNWFEERLYPPQPFTEQQQKAVNLYPSRPETKTKESIVSMTQASSVRCLVWREEANGKQLTELSWMMAL